MKVALTGRFMDYLADDGEWVFTPNVFFLAEDETETGTPSWELTETGAELAEQYLDDASCGYDLCYGRAKGLAQDYTDTQMLLELITSQEYCTEPVDKYFNLWELA